MAYETFTWVVQKDLTREPQLNVRVIQFGEGYEQRQATNLGAPLNHYSFTFRGTAAEADAAFNFLVRHGGVKPFYWTPPNDTVTRLVVCDEFQNTEYNGITHTVSGKFREVKS